MLDQGSQPVIAIVAGEASGDILGAGLMGALKKHYPNARFVGVCGPLMQEQGGETLFPMERLSVMGIFEVLPKIPELLQLRRQLIDFILAAKPTLCITIDSPDFTLAVANRLRREGVKTVHYVSPSIWAWRKGRIKTIKSGVDHMLTILPFEPAIYEEEGMEATFVGHPLADDIPLQIDQRAAREQLQLSPDKKVLAVLPGSRGGEVQRLLPTFLAAVKMLRRQYPELEIVLPAANDQRYQEIQTTIEALGLKNIHLIEGNSRIAMAAADVILIASGTATLEAALFKKPMVVAYKVGWLTYLIASLMIKIDYIALPNLLCDEEVVPELIQANMTPESLYSAVCHWFESPQEVEQLQHKFMALHELLKLDASQTAATVVKDLIEQENA